MWVHLGMAECRVPFSGRCDLDLGPSFENNRARSISLIFFEVGILFGVDASWDVEKSRTIIGSLWP